MKKITVLLLMLFVGSTCLAQVYKKIDPVTGHITITNIPPRSIQASTEQQTPIALPVEKKVVAKVKNVPANFPKLSPEIQKERDSERKRILDDELKSEQAALKNASIQKTDPDTIARHKQNIVALEREIASIK